MLKVVGDETAQDGTGGRSLLDEIAREGARRMLLAALETEPGVFEVQLTGLSPGEHRLQASARLAGRPWGEDKLVFHWEAAPPETPMDRQWLTALAERSSGVMRELSTADARELLDRLPEPRLEAETMNRRRPFSAPAWVLIAAALLLGEWAWRRLKGLP